MSLVDGWNQLWSLLPNSEAIGTILAVIGVAILVFSIIKWLWDRRRGGGVGIGGFPWVAAILGAVLAGPQLMIPVLLGVLDVVIQLAVNIFQWVTGQF